MTNREDADRFYLGDILAIAVLCVICVVRLIQRRGNPDVVIRD